MLMGQIPRNRITSFFKEWSEEKEGYYQRLGNSNLVKICLKYMGDHERFKVSIPIAYF